MPTGTAVVNHRYHLRRIPLDPARPWSRRLTVEAPSLGVAILDAVCDQWRADAGNPPVMLVQPFFDVLTAKGRNYLCVVTLDDENVCTVRGYRGLAMSRVRIDPACLDRLTPGLFERYKVATTFPQDGTPGARWERQPDPEPPAAVPPTPPIPPATASPPARQPANRPRCLGSGGGVTNRTKAEIIAELNAEYPDYEVKFLTREEHERMIAEGAEVVWMD